MSQSCRAHLLFGARLIQQNSRFQFFFAWKFFFFHCFMKFLVKIYMKRYERHKVSYRVFHILSKYTWKDMKDTIRHFGQQTSSTLCFVLYLVHPKIKFHISYWTKVVTDSNLAPLLRGIKCLKKLHLGQLFQSVTSFET